MRLRPSWLAALLTVLLHQLLRMIPRSQTICLAPGLKTLRLSRVESLARSPLESILAVYHLLLIAILGHDGETRQTGQDVFVDKGLDYHEVHLANP